MLIQSNNYVTHVRDSGMNDLGRTNNALCYIRFVLVFLTVTVAG